MHKANKPKHAHLLKRDQSTTVGWCIDSDLALRVEAYGWPRNHPGHQQVAFGEERKRKLFWNKQFSRERLVMTKELRDMLVEIRRLHFGEKDTDEEKLSRMIRTARPIIHKYYENFTIEDVSVKERCPWTDFQITIEITNNNVEYEMAPEPERPDPIPAE